ncbi:alpha/beta hydrolase [Paenirhodobacter sp.]|uniref:alpha/beta hydrolase n=1 Tax=Paenirhodobacter sp. TaxID=1965326 RepID=UPI003B50AFD7
MVPARLIPAAPFLPGLALGALCFCAALTPSLVPRGGLLQGALAGLGFAAGYGVAVAGGMLWRWLGFGMPQRHRGLALAVLAAALGAMLWSLGRAARGQEALHQAMGLPPVETVRPITIALTALLVAGVLILLGRLLGHVVQAVARRLSAALPPRVALIGGVLVALVGVEMLGNQLLLRQALGAFDASYRRLDAAFPEEDGAPPQDPLKTGSAASLLRWEDLGAEGRNRIADPLDAQGIAAIAGAPAQEPLRIYVGLGSAETPQERARLALQEAIRVGAFARATLVIATPTGTGWVDPAAMFPLEALSRGDVATISVQYSYLPSWLSLLTVPEYGQETARAVFSAIHGYWRSLPRDQRPKLYLFGLSLGALNSDLSADFYDLVGAPYQGAFWVGPPFGSRSWRHITDARNPGSPEWLPEFRDGSVVRFLNQSGLPDGAPWGPLRIVYLQYASDPITFFAPSILWRQPDWMRAPQGPGVAAELRWLPLVSFLQIGFDVLTATTTPQGHGHVYAGRDYLNGWLALLSPEGWDAPALERLRAAMASRGL